MNKNLFRIVEIVVSMIIGVIIVTYTKDILLSIVFVIPIAIAYSLFTEYLRSEKNK